jgi:DNA (cytosine-5)-methyltransferase 1
MWLLEASPVNHFQWREGAKERMMGETAGPSASKLFAELSQDSFLEKTCQELLTYKWHSDLVSLTWKVKVTTYNVLYYQLQQSVLHTKEKEFGLWPTPTAMTGGQGVAPSHKKGKHGWNIGAAVNDSMNKNPARMWPTPNARDHKDTGKNTDYVKVAKKSKLAGTVGGALNPTWVEWLMGYKDGYTDLKDWEMLSSRKLRKKLVKQ